MISINIKQVCNQIEVTVNLPSTSGTDARNETLPQVSEIVSTY